MEVKEYFARVHIKVCEHNATPLSPQVWYPDRYLDVGSGSSARTRNARNAFYKRTRNDYRLIFSDPDAAGEREVLGLQKRCHEPRKSPIFGADGSSTLLFLLSPSPTPVWVASHHYSSSTVHKNELVLSLVSSPPSYSSHPVASRRIPSSASPEFPHFVSNWNRGEES